MCHFLHLSSKRQAWSFDRNVRILIGVEIESALLKKLAERFRVRAEAGALAFD
jgi:hypothetical protein